MKSVEQLNVKIFADGAEKAAMLEMYAKPCVSVLPAASPIQAAILSR